ncbi:PHP domain-containing protein, partial [Intrasporangium oryzae]|uniref:PHP domain-containing protein n=1 Tax=Intrasporangium oryzae TaxID=412687 RepID=UPI00054D115D
MNDSFVHLHVASGYSMRYGTAKPEQLVDRAVAWGQPALALTDRDGLYGAVKFVRACMDRGIAPVLGVDLALEPDPSAPPVARSRSAGPARGRAADGRAERTPVRGGALV